MHMNDQKLLRESEFLSALRDEDISLTGRMSRNYVKKGILPKPIRIPGEGNILFYEPAWIERVKLIHRLVQMGETLDGIHKILSSARDSDIQLLNFLKDLKHREAHQYVFDQLKAGKALDALLKDKVIDAKEEFCLKFDEKFGKDRYERMKGDYFHILQEYRALFDPKWTREEILGEFGLSAEELDFSTPKSIRMFKKNFYHRLAQFLRNKSNQLKEAADEFDFRASNYEQLIK